MKILNHKFISTTPNLRSFRKTSTMLMSFPTDTMISESISQLQSSKSILTSLKLTIDAWSVNGIDLNSSDFASTLFACSLFPYLAFLYFLGR